MPTRDELDAIAWRTIHAKPKLALAEARGTRPLDYLQLEKQLQAGTDFEHSWSDFLHAFYDYKDASFFAYPSPPSLSVEMQAVLAGAAEWLSAEFGLPHPEWTEDRRYFLPEPWHIFEIYGLDMSAHVGEGLARSPHAFRRRNIAFLARNLIAL
jgi:hypothetical protein